MEDGEDDGRPVRSLEEEENAIADEARYQLNRLRWPSNHSRYMTDIPGEVVVGGQGEIYIQYLFDLKVDSGLRNGENVVNSTNRLFCNLENFWRFRTYFHNLDSALASAHNRISMIQQGTQQSTSSCLPAYYY